MTIHELEALANEVCEETETAKQKLARMIRAFARIINAKSPSSFPQMPLEYSDVDGHWDNSYPPKQVYKKKSGPRLIVIIHDEQDSNATTSGFYHSSEYFTTDRGLYVSPTGEFFGCDEHGTGRFGQFAAHPGDCDVHCECEYDTIDLDDIPLDRLQKAEKELRDLAFPLVAARLAKEVQS
jgi:hypothetical protein